MPYPQRLLNDGEEVALDIHPHWWFFAKSAAATLFSSVLFLWSAVALGDATWEKGLKWLFGVTAIVSLLWLGVRWLVWRTTHFVITSDRLIARKGIIAKSGIEIPLERVNNVSFNQSIFERVIKAGDLLIESGGEDGQQRFTDILRPDEVQNLIHLQMEENQRRTFTPAAQPIDVAGQLEKLEALRDRGTITEAEFESQKRRLLD
ncbi:MAG: PH domain-containing protein [Actinobacteria bacterium]|nr:PH domain-containing protein [Actinomycetota bacterium]